MGAQSDTTGSSPSKWGRPSLGWTVAGPVVLLYGVWLLVARPDRYEAAAALFMVAFAIAVLVFVAKAVTEKQPELAPGDEAEIAGRRYVVTGYGLGRKLSGKARWINIGTLAGGFLLLVLVIATGGAGPEADPTVPQSLGYILGVVLILGAFMGPELAAMFSRIWRRAPSRVVVVSRAEGPGSTATRAIGPAWAPEAQVAKAPAAKWILLAGRLLLAIGLITTVATHGDVSIPLAVAGFLSLCLAVRWATSSAAWTRDYMWMRGLSQAEQALYIGWSVGGKARPAGASRAIATAITLAIAAVLMGIGVGSHAGWL